MSAECPPDQSLAFCNCTPLISPLDKPSLLHRNRTSCWIAWEKCFQLFCTSGLSVILKEAKTFNQNESLSDQQLRNINIMSCVSEAEGMRCEQNVPGWCNIKMLRFRYLQVGIFPFWLYTPLSDGVSVTPVTWRCLAPSAVRHESSRYLLRCASIWLGFYVLEQEGVMRRYAGHVSAWSTAMFCSIMKFWTDIAERVGALCWYGRWCWVRRLSIRFLLTFTVVVNHKSSVLVKVLTQCSRISLIYLHDIQREISKPSAKVLRLLRCE